MINQLDKIFILFRLFTFNEFYMTYVKLDRLLFRLNLFVFILFFIWQHHIIHALLKGSTFSVADTFGSASSECVADVIFVAGTNSPHITVAVSSHATICISSTHSWGAYISFSKRSAWPERISCMLSGARANGLVVSGDTFGPTSASSYTRIDASKVLTSSVRRTIFVFCNKKDEVELFGKILFFQSLPIHSPLMQLVRGSPS